MRRRFHLIPFTVTVPASKRDPLLVQRLQSEWPGILAWMIAGHKKWRDERLNPPEAVAVATADYFEDEDEIGCWLEECCRQSEHAWAKQAELFKSWCEWAQTAGTNGGDLKKFKERLEARGFERKRQAGTGQRGYSGIMVL